MTPQPKLTPDEVASRIRRKLHPGGADPGSISPEDASEELTRLRAQLRMLREDCRKVGELPPRPPTWRGSVGAFLVSIVHRALFWYTPTVQYAFSGVSESLEQAVSVLLARIQAAETRLAADAKERDARLRRDFEDRFNQLSAHLENTDTNLQAVRREYLGLSLRVAKLLEEGRAGFNLQPGLQSPQAGSSPPEAAATDLDPLYISFEDRFRGTRREIQEGVRMYLPFVREACQEVVPPVTSEDLRPAPPVTVEAARQAMDEPKPVPGPAPGPILDIGCGRGEWLELLRDEGFRARGVDVNGSMIEECRRHSLEGVPLDAVQADALEYLARLPDNSLAAVTGFHIVEHLPFEKLVRLLDEVTRVLRPGGVAIFETPNPDNLLVGSRNFYFDPTHRNPIPSPTLRFLVESRGLSRVEVLPLHPCDPVNLVPNQDGNILTQKFNEFFYGPQDYAVIGRKV